MSLDSRLQSNPQDEAVAALIGERSQGRLIEVLDDGFVRLIDAMGTDSSIVQAARVSYGKGTKTISDDATLIRYLMRSRHTTPFEMVELKFHVRVPMDAWRQWVRHRTATISEYSTRYSEAIDSMRATQPDEWRVQSTTNKQGSGDGAVRWPESWEVIDDPSMSPGDWNLRNASIEDKPTLRKYPDMTPGEYLSNTERMFQIAARNQYQRRLDFGVAREQARKDLPLSTYTEAYWKIDLHNLLHFLGLRMEEHAQYEIRKYAGAIFQLTTAVAPIACEAFLDYRLDAMTLSKPEIKAIRSLLTGETIMSQTMTPREQHEFAAKLKRLGIEYPYPTTNAP